LSIINCSIQKSRTRTSKTKTRHRGDSEGAWKHCNQVRISERKGEEKVKERHSRKFTALQSDRQNNTQTRKQKTKKKHETQVPPRKGTTRQHGERLQKPRTMQTPYRARKDK